MKNILFILMVLCSSLNALAQLNGNGYYRIRNVGSQRYLTVKDNKGSIDINSTSADLGAAELYKNFENIVSDPGSVLYVQNVDNARYKFIAQGTDTYKIIGYYLKLKKNNDGSYKAYQETSLTVSYLCDAEKQPFIKGALGTNDRGTNYRDWNFLPLSASGDNYLGITPEVQSGGEFYGSFYASFPYTAVSSGMKVYYICLVDGDKAVYKEIIDNVVPAAVPVIVKCASAAATDNRLDVVANSVTAPKDNKLGGVYFCNTTNAHKNLTAYNAETMRVLGVTSSGKVGYVKADDVSCVKKDGVLYLSANRSYLNVPAGSPDELELIPYDEYITAIGAVQETGIDYSAIYTIKGNKVGASKDDFDNLPAGVYIVDGVKVVKR